MDQSSLVYGAVILLSGGIASLYTLLVLWSPPPIITHDSEKKYLSNASPKKPLPLTRLADPSTVDLTIVVPAFNETERLPAMMQDTIQHLASVSAGLEHKRTYEILVVDDGSSDGTSVTALELAKKYPQANIKVVTLEKNIGKGGAVRHGMLYAGGERLLMADADGASRIQDLEELWKAMDKIAPDNGPGVVVGSRAHLVKSEAVVKRSLLRNILMYGLHTILRIVGVGHIRDTQCGFKLFSRSAAQQIFPAQHLPTWIFDVELLLLAKQLRIPVAEVPIEWHEVAGSKLNVVTASVQMLRDLLIVRANHLLGRWTAYPAKQKSE
ncbi:Dolichyl-phosphate beta-glucosyltransferase [Psilocybe cubensis]|uniref:dolichyl-phosphate beta-glucosyltransferase n=2 Tax=Psilocybe cubensis TaxID=181762 RepID=A0A8H8CH91_PSICU|nr:Dolichyl-phosphate beta-glucosyltransferase [Psilocybe cubensis]KAH9479235.1 Dolichyl-phosphate beta-glucosyltransferase [Psilocybe cubensis]